MHIIKSIGFRSMVLAFLFAIHGKVSLGANEQDVESKSIFAFKKTELFLINPYPNHLSLFLGF